MTPLASRCPSEQKENRKVTPSHPPGALKRATEGTTMNHHVTARLASDKVQEMTDPTPCLSVASTQHSL